MYTDTTSPGRALRPGAPHLLASRFRFRAFTLTELLVVLALLALLAATLMPALARTKPNSLIAQCQNNLRQMARAWEMYAEDNSGKIVAAFPNFGGFTGTWCAGGATTDGSPRAYVYGGADPTGIQTGLLWPYVQSLSLYHCPTDHRVSTYPDSSYGKPILRSIAMNSALCGYLMNTPVGGSFPWTPVDTSRPIDPTYPTYLKQSEMKLPKQTFVFLCEDQASIDDGLFLMDVGGIARFYELPSRAHRFGYTISFADGHTEVYQLKDNASKTWTRPGPGGYNDWQKLVGVTTHPL